MKTLIKNINIIDPKKEEIDINSSIAVDNGQIKDIGKNISQNKSNYENIIDGEDNYILSGFI
ncbi:MAG: amidohydrolase family protein, partial [Methanobrevibacter sp.]|nr:amidohydrolase family protein [Methanobrevibacter sp.]